MKRTWTLDEIKGLEDRSIARRNFLKESAVLVSGASCAPFLPGVAYAADKDVIVFAWEGFTVEDALKPQLDKLGIALRVFAVATQDDVHTRLMGSTPTRLDVAPYNQVYADFYGKELGILTPLEEDALPSYNEADIFDVFYKEKTWYWDDKLWGVPSAWGLNTLVYNPALVPEVAKCEEFKLGF